jgi:hypothetical protein
MMMSVVSGLAGAAFVDSLRDFDAETLPGTRPSHGRGVIAPTAERR